MLVEVVVCIAHSSVEYYCYCERPKLEDSHSFIVTIPIENLLQTKFVFSKIKCHRIQNRCSMFLPTDGETHGARHLNAAAAAAAATKYQKSKVVTT